MGERRLDGAFDEEVGVFCCFADLDILTNCKALYRRACREC